MVLKSDNNLDIHHVIHVLNIFVFIKKDKNNKKLKKWSQATDFQDKIKLHCIFFKSIYNLESRIQCPPFFFNRSNISIFNDIFCFFFFYFLILVKKSNTCTRNCFNQLTNLTKLFKYTYTYNVQWNSETSYQTYVNHADTVTISYPAFNKNQVQEKLQIQVCDCLKLCTLCYILDVMYVDRIHAMFIQYKT